MSRNIYDCHCKVDNFKYMGILTGAKLTWNLQFIKIKKSKGLRIMYTAKMVYMASTLLTL